MEHGLAVVKLGGHAMDDEGLLDAFVADMAQLAAAGWQLVLVHGGGPHINALLRRLGIESNFVNGLRVTTEETLGAVEMALCGQVNKYLVRRMLQRGVDAVGISGEDGHLLEGRIQDEALGLVGEVVQVHPGPLHALLEGHYTPVVAPLALSALGQPLNVNADVAAGAIAGALQASYFILISDVPGVLDAQGQLLASLDGEAIAQLRASGVIHGGMIPKVQCAQEALARGCAQALILDGRAPHALSRCLTSGIQVGTVIVP